MPRLFLYTADITFSGLTPPPLAALRHRGKVRGNRCARVSTSPWREVMRVLVPVLRLWIAFLNGGEMCRAYSKDPLSRWLVVHAKCRDGYSISDGNCGTLN